MPAVEAQTVRRSGTSKDCACNIRTHAPVHAYAYVQICVYTGYLVAHMYIYICVYTYIYIFIYRFEIRDSEEVVSLSTTNTQ